jgi:hypothetical protein
MPISLNFQKIFSAVKPRIDRTTLKTVTIKVGRAHKWSVDVAGEPPPTISWVWRDSVALSNTERITIENRDYHTDFSIIEASRKDAGIYTLQAENKSGKDTESVELIVLGKFLIAGFLQNNLVQFHL